MLDLQSCFVAHDVCCENYMCSRTCMLLVVVTTIGISMSKVEVAN